MGARVGFEQSDRQTSPSAEKKYEIDMRSPQHIFQGREGISVIPNILCLSNKNLFTGQRNRLDRQDTLRRSKVSKLPGQKYAATITFLTAKENVIFCFVATTLCIVAQSIPGCISQA